MGKVLSIPIKEVDVTLEVAVRRPDGNHGYVKFQVVDKTRGGAFRINPELVPVLCLLQIAKHLVNMNVDPIATLTAALKVPEGTNNGQG